MFGIISRTWSVTNKNIQFSKNTKSYMAKRKEMLIYAAYFFLFHKI